MATITSHPSALAWPILQPWTPRRGFFWLAWTTVFWKFMKMRNLSCHLWKVEFDYFSSLESSLGPGVGSGVVLRELHSQELGQGAERIVLGIMILIIWNLKSDPIGLSKGRGTLHLLCLGLLFSSVCSPSWRPAPPSPCTSAQLWGRVQPHRAGKLKMFFLFFLQKGFCFLTSRCLTGFPAES